MCCKLEAKAAQIMVKPANYCQKEEWWEKWSKQELIFASESHKSFLSVQIWKHREAHHIGRYDKQKLGYTAIQHNKLLTQTSHTPVTLLFNILFHYLTWQSRNQHLKLSSVSHKNLSSNHTYKTTEHAPSQMTVFLPEMLLILWF